MGSFQHLFTSEQTASLDIDLARCVVRRYGDFLTTSAPLPGCVADTNQLPLDKELIRDSLFACIEATRDRELIEHLKYGCLMLSAWQDGVGPETRGLDFTELDLEADPWEVAELIEQKSAGVARWKPVIEREQAMLASRFRALGI